MFGGDFAPRGWALCAGQLFSIAQNTALFSILGTAYGGNGTTTFALPDLRGRGPIGTGTGPGLANVVIGEMAGSETVTLTAAELPAHTHSVAMPASTGAQTSNRPTSAYQASGNAYSSTTDTTMAAATSTAAGGGQPHSNRSPYLGMTYIIAVTGIFPSRN
jgi:microcystin-dependent protein